MGPRARRTAYVPQQSFIANYTNPAGVAPNPIGPQPPFDTRQRFTAAVNYAVPAIAGNHRLGSGWQLNTIVSIQSGRPVPIINSNDTSGCFYYNQRPDVVSGVSPILPDWNPESGYLNPLAFIQPAFGTFGDLGRNSIYCQDFATGIFSSPRIRD
jgi:hypothetical protein